MTPMEKIADWLSGGALTLARELSEFWRTRWSEAMDKNLAERAALRTIAAMETPNANATVRRMAKVAREALE